MAKKSSFKHLRMLAAQLPVQFQDGNIYIPGAEILKRNKNAKDAEGNAIDPEKVYKGATQFPVSNYRRMKKLFKKEGEAGVNKYVDDIIEQHQQTIRGHANVLNSMPSQPMSI
jgi:hypothetical protein